MKIVNWCVSWKKGLWSFAKIALITHFLLFYHSYLSKIETVQTIIKVSLLYFILLPLVDFLLERDLKMLPIHIGLFFMVATLGFIVGVFPL